MLLPAAIAACCASQHSHSPRPEKNQLDNYLPNIQPFPCFHSHLVLRVCQLCKAGDCDRDCLVVSCHLLSHCLHIPFFSPDSPIPCLLPAPRWRPQLANSSDAQLVGSPCLLANPGRTASLTAHPVPWKLRSTC